jgi:hypothetical protein
MRFSTPARLAAATAITIGTAALAVPAATAATATYGSCYFYDNVYNEPGACEDEATQYSESGVSVWNDPNNPTAVVAVGSAGQMFATFNQYVANGATVTCDNGVTTHSWYPGEDKPSGKVGWVPDCYLNGEPSG